MTSLLCYQHSAAKCLKRQNGVQVSSMAFSAFTQTWYPPKGLTVRWSKHLKLCSCKEILICCPMPAKGTKSRSWDRTDCADQLDCTWYKANTCNAPCMSLIVGAKVPLEYGGAFMASDTQLAMLTTSPSLHNAVPKEFHLQSLPEQQAVGEALATPTHTIQYVACG